MKYREQVSQTRIIHYLIINFNQELEPSTASFPDTGDPLDPLEESLFIQL